jgi:ABC-type multidrug transport system ATPase subunit
MPSPLIIAPALQVRKLSFAYPDQAPLFVDWNADLAHGVTLLQGDIGSGKTTLLRLLAGELPGSGELTLSGRRLGDDPEGYRRNLCWFNPRDAAFDAMTPARLMEAQRALHPGFDQAAWRRHLTGFDLEPHLAKPLYALSTGSRRKAGLAVALSVGCGLTLLDEPAAGLDAASVRYLSAALAGLARHPQRALLVVDAEGLEPVPGAGTLRLAGSPNRG